ncbi:hypothetical protein FQN54_001666 [Arachnomyces sp. PD_36]|nr:hypothetical protein FQN54_001666 [Arachnomyces sp. PD_36]
MWEDGSLPGPRPQRSEFPGSAASDVINEETVAGTALASKRLNPVVSLRVEDTAKSSELGDDEPNDISRFFDGRGHK